MTAFARAAPSIRLIGPGAAGKSTAGALLAERLDLPFVDLDRRFETRAGDISEYVGLRARKIETMRPLTAVMDELPRHLVVM